MITLYIICTVLFYIVTSIMEGIFFHSTSKAKLKFKYPHTFLVIMRSCFWAMLYFTTKNIAFVLGLIATFSFIHDGIYYIVRNRLNNKIYTKGFFDSSTTSTAIFEFNFIIRSLLFVTGLILLIYSILRIMNIWH